MIERGDAIRLTLRIGGMFCAHAQELRSLVNLRSIDIVNVAIAYVRWQCLKFNRSDRIRNRLRLSYDSFLGPYIEIKSHSGGIRVRHRV